MTSEHMREHLAHTHSHTHPRFVSARNKFYPQIFVSETAVLIQSV